MPNISGQAIALDLLAGTYRFNFSDFQSPDRSDAIRIESANGLFHDYRLDRTWTGWKVAQPTFDYFDRSLDDSIEIRLTQDDRLILRTDEGYDLGLEPNYPTASFTYARIDEAELEEPEIQPAPRSEDLHPLIQISRNSRGDAIEYPLDEADTLGSGVLRSYRAELRTDRNEVSVAQIEQDFFHGQVDLSSYGVSGSAGLWTTEPGINKVTFDMRGDYDAANLLFWNGESIVPIDPAHISNSTIEIYIDAVSDEWGFVLLDSNDTGDDTDFRISGLEWVGESSIVELDGGYIANIGGLSPSDSIGNVKIESHNASLSTGQSDRAASSLGDWAMGDKEFLKPYGTEGSAITYTDLEPGEYDFLWSFYTRDITNHDALYAWNGKTLTQIGDRTDGYSDFPRQAWTSEDLNASVEVVYDYLTIIALDAGDKRGTTDFRVEGLRRTGDLGYEPPQPIDIAPDILTGDINLKDGYTGIATGTGDRAISTLGTELTGDRDALTDYGTEGSYAKWTGLDNGTYEVTWSLYASENDFDRDAVYFWDGSEAQPLATRADATIQSSATRWISDRTTSTFDVTNGELGFLALDELDKSGTTEMRIYSIEKVGSSTQNPSTENGFDPITGTREEPPYPIPDNGWDMGNDADRAWDMGTLKPWETDDMTGIEWNQGYVYPAYHLGASYINETIGGDDVTDWATFVLEEASYLNFFHSNAIAEIMDESDRVVVGSNDSYSGNLQALLLPGQYQMRFSSESSVSETFSAQIYLSNSDPSYAD
ncbi:hypothetical protein IQ235_01015 [Oscillatoriales cyanobacterium LEGE 11467]|uniref:Uncharacterized protein n=1 Tax=Zarconia navalis LEGE 11467 TaxID=1828826 RepID=A0A928VW77_9CYAN|nr:hypothetical protein [Zarconia navalis]MBE9039376.1 hypothetical protein [Zarconia navalis LEGE 11467]